MAKPLKKNRPQDAQSVVFVYCSEEEKKLLEAATAKLVETQLPGAKLPTYKFLLKAGLAEARKVLGK